MAITNSSDYQHQYTVYNFDPVDGGHAGIYLSSSMGWKLADDVDGSGNIIGDGVENASEEVFERLFEGYSYSYTGWTVNGDPILELNSSPGTFYLFSNNGSVAAGATPTSGSYIYCFAKGTCITTPAEAMTVEDLQIGDTVLNNQDQHVTVKWIGHQTINPLFARLNGQMPIRVAAGALGENVPSRDLYVTPDHALLVDGCLVHASALINGRTITQVTGWEGDIEYYHIETEAHEIILAENTPAETFIDNVSREKFDNHAEYAVLYPDAQPMVEMDLPRVKYARQLPMAIKRRLEAIADQLQGPVAQAV